MWPFLTAGLSGLSSLAGSFMNSSSTAAANAANLNFAEEKAGGGFLPSLVANAKAAGINPLAALGINTSASSAQIGTDPGQGLQSLAKLSSSFNPDVQRQRDLDMRAQETAIQAGNADVTRKNAEAELALQTWRRVASDPSLIPGGWQQPTPSGEIGSAFHHVGMDIDRLATQGYDWMRSAIPGMQRGFRNTDWFGDSEFRSLERLAPTERWW